MRKFFTMFFMVLTCRSALAVPVPNDSIVPVVPVAPTVPVTGEADAVAPHDEAPAAPKPGGVKLGLPAITINTDNPLDMNWMGALELSDAAQRPAPVELPFLPDFPIDNLEIKLHLLNVKF